MTVSLVLWLCGVMLGGEARTTALAVTVFMIASLSYATIETGIAALPFEHAAPVTYVCMLGIAALMLLVRHRAAMLTTFANHALVIVLVPLSVQLFRQEWPGSTRVKTQVGLHIGRSSDRPDVYVLILDAYGRQDVLRERYGFDNDLVPALRSLGFAVGSESVSNYSLTAHSLASALNLDYLPALLEERAARAPDRAVLGELIANNRLFAAFADAGYRITAYGSEYGLIQPGPTATRPRPFGVMNDFDQAAYEASAVPAVLEAMGVQRGWMPLHLHRRQVQWTLEDLARARVDEGGEPRLIFAHVLAPHPPFAFNPDGTARQTLLPALLIDDGEWRAKAERTGESYAAAYVDTLRYLNARVVETFTQVLANARRPTIIYIQGDHGPRGELNGEHPDGSDLRERHGIMLAMRFPDGSAPPIDSRTTPINAFRVLVNRALGTDLPALEDRSYYFATWQRPAELIDVTDRVR